MSKCWVITERYPLRIFSQILPTSLAQTCTQKRKLSSISKYSGLACTNHLQPPCSPLLKLILESRLYPLPLQILPQPCTAPPVKYSIQRPRWWIHPRSQGLRAYLPHPQCYQWYRTNHSLRPGLLIHMPASPAVWSVSVSWHLRGCIDINPSVMEPKQQVLLNRVPPFPNLMAFTNEPS